ncbi:MAG TPA: tetratricopeptide repeat protein, partial [Gemmataceae bacterium]|nr:tetratricopeptide repeat protein [Gemmataceae bacterium]
MELATGLNNLGLLSTNLGRSEQALAYHRQALAMYEELYAADKFPNGHPEIAKSLNNVGRALSAIGQDAEALDHLQRSLEMFRRLYPASKYPDGHPRLAAIYNNVGHQLSKMGQADSALAYVRQGNEQCLKLYSPSIYPLGHPELADSYHNLGSALVAAGRTDEAWQTLAKAMTMQTRLLKRESATASESVALDLAARHRRSTIHAFLSASESMPNTEAESYAAIFELKGTVQSILHRRHLAALIQSQHSIETRRAFDRLANVQREIGRLLGNAAQDLSARDQRLAELNDDRDRLTRELSKT